MIKADLARWSNVIKETGLKATEGELKAAGEDAMNDRAPDDRLRRDVPVAGQQSADAWGSDAIAALLRDMDIPYVLLNPGSSFRGLHDSLVNFLGNERPQMLLVLHEEHAVAIAHGYAKVTGSRCSASCTATSA